MSLKDLAPERSAAVLFLLRVAPWQQVKEGDNFDCEPPLHRLRPSFAKISPFMQAQDGAVFLLASLTRSP